MGKNNMKLCDTNIIARFQKIVNTDFCLWYDFYVTFRRIKSNIKQNFIKLYKALAIYRKM